MKKLTKSKRDTVRFLLKRVLNDLKVAKDFTFKAYGSSETTFDIKFAISNIESALRNLPKTKLPKKTDASPADRPKDCPAKDNECPMQTAKTEESDTEKRFQECICDNLNVLPEQCIPEARFVEDLGADSFALLELVLALEYVLKVTISQEEFYRSRTYGNLLDLVKAKIAAKEANPPSGEDIEEKFLK